jgi:hypothetical protein
VLVAYAAASSIGVVRSGVEMRAPLEYPPFSIQNSESGEVTHLAVELDACRGTIVVSGDVDEAVVERSRSFLKAFVSPPVAPPTGLRSCVGAHQDPRESGLADRS